MIHYPRARFPVLRMSDRPGFINYLEKKGCFGSVVSVRHLDELGGEIRALHGKGLLADAIYNYTGTEKPFHSPRLPRNMPGAKSIIIVATPQPMLRTTFHHDGKAYKLEVPPTYSDVLRIVDRARALLKEAFLPCDQRLVYARLPQKLMAVRSGLAMYGRNNITYIPKFGSFYRPSVFYSDYESPVDYWREKQALPLCSRCTACRMACPTGAIQKDRFLIKADICLTYLNEKSSKAAFPRWVKDSSHNALIGCMRCQKACPYDRNLKDWYEDRGEFSEEETEYLLRGKFSGSKAKKMERKLKSIGLDLSVMPRNLKVLLRA
jgi:epoxyqueuosine reductase